MDLSKIIFHSKNCISFFLMLFFFNNLLVEANENKLEEFYSKSQIDYNEHDNIDNQFNMFFGVDPENPGFSYYPDVLIISDSDYIREMYKLKLNDMTINEINYSIER